MKTYFFCVISLLLICYDQSDASIVHEKSNDAFHQTHMHPAPSNDARKTRSKREDVKFFHINDIESTSSYWRADAQKKLRQQLEKKTNTNVAKNLIMFLGDGMSISTITAARIYFGQKSGMPGEETLLSFENFPHLGLSKVS